MNQMILSIASRVLAPKASVLLFGKLQDYYITGMGEFQKDFSRFGGYGGMLSWQKGALMNARPVFSARGRAFAVNVMNWIWHFLSIVL